MMMMPRMLTRLIMMLLVFAIMACSPAELPAKVLFTNAKIYTQSESQAWAEAVLVDSGRILYVGAEAEARRLAGEDTAEYDLKGRLVLPGFIDTHSHPVLGASLLDSLELNPADEPEVWLRQIKEYAADKDEAFVFGLGIFAKKFGDHGPTKEALDRIIADRPALIVDEGGHTAWANSAALAKAGITADSVDPVPGKHYYQRDENGEPTGYAVEHLAWMPIAEAIGVFSGDRLTASVKQAFPLLSMFGITTVYEAGMLALADAGHEVLRTLEDEGGLTIRFQTSISVVDASQAKTAVADLQTLRRRWASDLVDPRVIKIHNDGTTEAETSAQFEPYLNNPDNRGTMMLSGKPLADLVTSAARAGLNVHIHSIGERAVSAALDAFEIARKAVPSSTSRFSTAHTELIQQSDQARFAALDVVAQTTPVWFIGGDAHLLEVLGAERVARKYHFREVLSAGGKVTFGSDFPVGGGLPALQPLINIAVGMTRKYPGLSAAPGVGDQALTLQEMLRGYTLDAAYQLGMESEVGSIEAGKKADFVVLTHDIFQQHVEDIPDTRVALTVMNGSIVYKRSFRSWITEVVLGI
jgi:predicted amidohydrolase YtcJ